MFDPCRGRSGFGGAFPQLDRGARIVKPLPGLYTECSGRMRLVGGVCCRTPGRSHGDPQCRFLEVGLRKCVVGGGENRRKCDVLGVGGQVLN
jgi:hypothetical protein